MKHSVVPLGLTYRGTIGKKVLIDLQGKAHFDIEMVDRIRNVVDAPICYTVGIERATSTANDGIDCPFRSVGTSAG